MLGYFVECSAGKADALFQPPLNATFIHRQTLANQARFTTVELAELDARIAQAADRALAMEVETFEALRRAACDLAQPLLAAADALAALDVAAGLAEWAVEVGAVRPEIDDSLVFHAEAARHPVVEAAVKRAGDPFTPNDCRLDGSGATCGAPVHRHRAEHGGQVAPSCARTRSWPCWPRPGPTCPPGALRHGGGGPAVQPRGGGGRPGARAAPPS